MPDIAESLARIAARHRVQMFVWPLPNGEFQANVATDGKSWAVFKGPGAAVQLARALEARVKVMEAHGDIAPETPGLEDLLG